MRKTYTAPSAEKIALETEEILVISFTGTGSLIEEKNEADKKPAFNFGSIELF